tara:strand:+ start:564 stop:845 length:282 start_codon:yes stop_codon:yes gene_type:complete
MTTRKNNIKCKRNFILEDRDIDAILSELNGSEVFNKQEYKTKNTVSFFDDDDICYFILTMPEYEDFDNDIFDVVDLFGAWFGITACKVNGDWL